jgi:eukaryotic-like serine/threonine-protein kinase
LVSRIEATTASEVIVVHAGDHVGPYEIESALGAGGMGEVYRATDTNLGRQVAIKVLPEAFAQDPERIARFEREAKTLASLNHPNIAIIHGLEKSQGTYALVMELVEGEDLSQRIARGPIPIDESLLIAKQIAEALEAAHEQGVIHRDLKPANIKIRSDGTVKVLDFGLAKLNESSSPANPSAMSMSPTITSPALMSGVGVLLGTAAYMSPEQAKGRPADKRSDIWAFGCVLFEMLMGKRAFEGEDVSDTLANVLKIDPDWSALPSEIPPAIRALLQSCLTKDRRRRVADISTALFVLEKGASLASPAGTVSPAPLPRRTLRWWVAALTGVVLVVAAVTGAAVWLATIPAPPRVSRLTLASTGVAALSINGNDRDLAITPDGSRVVYVGNGGTQLFVRALDALEPVAVFTGAPRGPFVSPDGQWIGFFDGPNALRKVAITGGPAVTLGTGNEGSRGATWGPEDTIIFATSNTTTGLQRLAAEGRTTVVTRPDRAQGEADHIFPELLPGGRAVLFTITALNGGLGAAQVAVLDLATGTRKTLVRGGSDAHFVPSGHLVYAAAGTLWAVSFDLTRLETRGTPVPVARNVVTTREGGVEAVVANDGTLAYVSGPSLAGAQRTLVWVDRQGHETPIPMPPGAYVYPRLSPDGTRLAVEARDRENDIWVWDLSRTTLTRVTFNPGIDDYPVWTPDGRRLITSSAFDGSGNRNLFWQAADGTRAVERLTVSSNLQDPTAVSPDGRRLVFNDVENEKAREDVMQLELDETRRVTPLVQSPFRERNGMISPDGRWLAYEANDSGRFEIYVRPYPDVNSGHWQVSTGGGTRALWTRSGQELLYASPTGALMRVGVERGSSWAATTPTMLVKEGYETIPSATAATGRGYDISSDGQRFLMIKDGGGSEQTATRPEVILVQHWTEELKRLVRTK